MLGFRKTNLYLRMWWLWPLRFVLIVGAQAAFGTRVFGYGVIPMSFVMALGSAVFGVVGLRLAFKFRAGRRVTWPWASALATCAPACIFVALAVVPTFGREPSSLAPLIVAVCIGTVAALVLQFRGA
jgi:hypothetical protein